jgi:hypothetical protein
VLVYRVRTLRLLPLVLRHSDPVMHSDPLDHEHAVLVLNLALGFDVVGASLNLDLTRLQRAGKGARQSAGGCRHHVVKGGGLRRELVGVGAVVLGDFRVHPETDRLVSSGNVSQALRPAEPLDSHV